jgi:xylulokinase
MILDIVIGIDSSTSATKAIAWDREGKIAASGRADIPMSNPQPGYFEQDPADWWNSTIKALLQVTSMIDPARVAGLAISNQRETFGLFTEDGVAVSPGTIWLDERARRQERHFGQEFGAERIHAISGKPLDIIPCLYRMIWFREERPDVFAQAERLADVHGMLAFRLTGRWATSTASADPMGVFDMRAGGWSSEILEAAGIPLRTMLELERPGETIGAVTASAARETGLREGTPVIAGGGDGQCAGTGAGVLREGRAYINLGTAVVSGMYGRSYRYDPAFRTETAIAEDGYIFETCLRSGTFLVDWMTRVLITPPDGAAEHLKMLEKEAAAAPVGAGGLVLLPYWQGVMDPHWDSSARGVIAGLSGSTRRGHVYRATLEAIALHQAETSRRAAEAIGNEAKEYIAIGGGAASDLWMQILADALGKPVGRTSTVEASSLGAAMAAAKAVGWFGTIAEASGAMAGEIARRFEPDARRAASYAELRALHAELWPALQAWNRKLAAFVERSID